MMGHKWFGSELSLLPSLTQDSHMTILSATGDLFLGSKSARVHWGLGSPDFHVQLELSLAILQKLFSFSFSSPLLPILFTNCFLYWTVCCEPSYDSFNATLLLWRSTSCLGCEHLSEPASTEFSMFLMNLFIPFLKNETSGKRHGGILDNFCKCRFWFVVDFQRPVGE